ncbi:cutinase family protein [Rhodococcus sp. NPDC057014]|uniref:cutinase family protein n=1 Tax=Rhodococcus sp. NPDC057014 TaxID=3346000 RepID=UPI00363BBF42
MARSARGRLAAVTTITAVLCGAVLSCAPAIAHADPGCASTFNLLIPGTWETDENADPDRPVGMLAPVAEAIEAKNGARAQTYTLPYMARAFDNGHTYADSKLDAVDKATAVLESYADKCQGAKITITGYSQGADAAGDLASMIGSARGPVEADRVLGVALIADPGAGTQGAATVGPTTSGEGIAGPRSQGMGALSGRVASICDPKDLYCSIRKGANPFLGSLGSILSKTPSTTNTSAGGGDAAVAAALTSDFSGADLPGLGSNVDALGKQLSGNDTGGTVDVHQIADAATSLSKTLRPLADLLQSGAANTATTTLAAAPVGTPEHAAAQVLTTAGHADLAGALDSVATIANTAAALANNGTTTLPAAAPEISELAGTAATLGGQIAPVAATPADALSSASSVLSVLKPTVVVDQALNVVTGVTALDIPAILHNLTVLPQKIAAGDVRGARDAARELNVQFAPVVKMAAGVDLKWISQILAIIPDPTGYTQIAALVTSVLGNVDVIKLATIAGQAQEIAWAAADKLFPPPGVLPDPVGGAAQTTALLPLGLELASVAVNMLTGTAGKTDPTLLGKQAANPVGNAITTQAQTLDLKGLAGSVSTMARSQGAEDLAAVVGEGLNAASFLASGAHQSYQHLVVDNAGRNAIQWVSDWLNLQITRAA